MNPRNTGRLLKIASNQMVRDLDKFADQFDLTSTQMAIIDYLVNNENKEILQKDLEKEFSIQRSTATVLLQRMEKKELVYRKASKKDARQKSIHLSEHAHKLSTKVSKYMELQQKQLEKRFSKETIDLFEEILHFYIKKENEYEG
ncbi:MarR family transcriptional regulator [Listeria aquatica]|uniref:MarR family transcriptional regulator n=1 Tax=Listeria aquatica TaxID=1494960 RepID=A0A841ZT77_9LIST|nr:MarR family transcriptional regulator [Listeria aquatica]MBC1522130.1 MarR family transcriptional regulator [Listeria aquatica]